MLFWSRLLAAKTNRKVLFSEVLRARVEAGRSPRDPVLGWGMEGRGKQGPWDQTHLHSNAGPSPDQLCRF